MGGEENTRLCITLYMKPGKSDLRTMRTFDAVLATPGGKSNSVIKAESVERRKHQKYIKKQVMVYGLNKKKKICSDFILNVQKTRKLNTSYTFSCQNNSMKSVSLKWVHSCT